MRVTGSLRCHRGVPRLRRGRTVTARFRGGGFAPEAVHPPTPTLPSSSPPPPVRLLVHLDVHRPTPDCLCAGWQVLRGELVTFMFIFMLFISAFVFTLIAIYPNHPAAGPLPQSADFIHPFLAANAILMAGMTGEVLDLNMHPDFLAPLGAWQKVNLSVFFMIYLLYVFLSLCAPPCHHLTTARHAASVPRPQPRPQPRLPPLTRPNPSRPPLLPPAPPPPQPPPALHRILLLNLLIALLGSTFSKVSEEATLQGRIAFARMVSRLELVAEHFNINTHAGEPEGDTFVHHFRDYKRDLEGELPRDYKDENVFDEVPEHLNDSKEAKAHQLEHDVAQLKTLVLGMKGDLLASVKEALANAPAPALMNTSPTRPRGESQGRKLANGGAVLSQRPKPSCTAVDLAAKPAVRPPSCATRPHKPSTPPPAILAHPGNGGDPNAKAPSSQARPAKDFKNSQVSPTPIRTGAFAFDQADTDHDAPPSTALPQVAAVAAAAQAEGGGEGRGESDAQITPESGASRVASARIARSKSRAGEKSRSGGTAR